MRGRIARRLCALALLGAALLSGAATAEPRSALREADFESGRYRQPVPLAAYAPAGVAAAPLHSLQGRLRIRGGAPRTRTLVADPAFLRDGDARRARSFPEDVELQLVQQGELLLPAPRGPQRSAHPWWEFLAEPGRAWHEPGEGGIDRWVLPFALVQRNANCTHNGLLMLMLRDGQPLPRAAVQISSETCQYLKFDLWGFVDVEFKAGEVAGREALLAEHQAELAARLPTRPLAALASVAEVDPAAFSIGDPDADSRHGLLYRGVHYSSACTTRHGAYPHCEVLDLPSFSLAKTVVAGIALMRIEQRWPGSADSRLSEWVDHPACLTEPWGRVRLRDLLDMASGHYDSARYFADEDAERIGAFFWPEDHASKLAFACGAYPARVEPGKRWVYHTSDTYLLGTALNTLLRRKTGDAGQDIFRDVVVAEIFAPLALSPTARHSRRSRDAAAQPFFGWGLVLHADDILKLADFLGRGQGRIGDRQLLDPGLLRQALQRDPERRGLQAAHLERFRYQLGLWARDVAPVIGCESPTYVPFMSGFGGLTVALFPNGLAWYKFSDDGQLDSIDFAAPARAAARLGSDCLRP